MFKRCGYTVLEADKCIAVRQGRQCRECLYVDRLYSCTGCSGELGLLHAKSLQV